MVVTYKRQKSLQWAVRYLPFHDGGRHHIETSPLICSTNQWTGFYIPTMKIRTCIKNNILDQKHNQNSVKHLIWSALQKWRYLTIFAKSYVFNIWEDSYHASGKYNNFLHANLILHKLESHFEIDISACKSSLINFACIVLFINYSWNSERAWPNLYL